MTHHEFNTEPLDVTGEPELDTGKNSNRRHTEWDAQLYRDDRDLILASAISPEVASARGYYTAYDKRDLRNLGFSRSQQDRRPALVLPVHNVYGDIVTHQMRPWAPRTDEKGRPRKYELPYGTSMVLDVPTATRPLLDNPNIPLWITEGIRKADSGASHGLCIIDLLGVYNFRGKNTHGGLTVLPDWEAIALNDRIVNIVFDSDVMTKLPVHKAMQRLAAFLRQRGAKVGFAYLPSANGAKVGLDDFFAAGGTVDGVVKLVRADLLPPPSQTGERDDSGETRGREDFYAYLPAHKYIYRPTGALWPETSVNRTVPPIPIGVDTDGEPKTLSAGTWLDRNRSVSQMTWAPGFEEIVNGWVFNEAGWIAQPGERIYNLYRGPQPLDGDATAAQPWVDHVTKVYLENAEHIIRWLAHRVQEPAQKINHALVLGGAPGIGKDTILEAVKYAVGPWNVGDVSPHQVVGRFNGFLKNIILRISEARDLGEVNRYGFYEHTKTITASPPEALRIDEKYSGEYYIWNAVGIVYTTNNRTNGLYLPADDRRHYVAWSDLSPSDFPAGYWERLYDWYSDGGYGHVAAYLASYDLSAFNPKAPPEKTPAFWDMVDASRAPEESEIADALDTLGHPDVVTISMIVAAFGRSLTTQATALSYWLTDRKNSRQIPHRMEAVGYTRVRNDGAKDGQWKIDGKRQAVYGRKTLSRRDQITAAQALIGR